MTCRGKQGFQITKCQETFIFRTITHFLNISYNSKKNSSESKINQRTIQEFKIRIKKNSRLKKKVKSQESRFKVQDLKNQDQDSRIKRRLNQDKYEKVFLKN